MKAFIVLLLALLPVKSFATSYELKLACKAAAAGMPNGAGATVYYPNGRTLTSAAGKSGATWYFPNGRTLTSAAS